MLSESSQSLTRPEILQVADAVARDKSIDPAIVIEAMEQAIQTAARRKYGQELDIRATIEKGSGEIRLARMREVVEALAAEHGIAPDFSVTIGIVDGARLAEKTWNPRLGIVGGLSILGTTGIVHPFSCASWIHAIHRGVDVARAAGITHLVGPTGSASETAARHLLPHLPDLSFIDMGDFVGGLVKYLRTHPVDRLTIAGGFAKMTKLAQGAMDLHSGRSQVDLRFLGALARQAGADDALGARIEAANTGKEALDLCHKAGIDLAAPIATQARIEATALLRGAPVAIDVIVTDRGGRVIASAS